MQVTFIPGIESASGTFRKYKNGDRIIVTTRKAPTTDTKNRTRMYFRSAADYQRKSPVTEKEMAARSLFKRRQALVRELMKAHKFRTLKEAWDFVRQEITK